MFEHTLKTWSRYYRRVQDGSKPFEIRKNDRDFQKGDVLCLIETDDETGEATGRHMFREVSYITDFAQRKGYVVLGLARPTEPAKE